MKFYKHSQLFLFLLQFQFYIFCEAIGFSEDCSKDARKADSTLLKFVFVADRTASFLPVLSKLYDGIEPISKEVENLYPDTEWGLAFFADYQKDAQPDLGDDEKNPHNNAESCCGRYKSLDKDYRHTRRSIGKDIKPVPNGGKENSLHGLAWIATDPVVGWEKNPQGKTVKKLAVLMTERGYGNISNPGNRHGFIGDGSDRCSTSLPPTIQQVGDILKKNDIAVIGLLPFGKFESNVLQTYEQYFQQMPGVPFCGKTFNIETESNIETLIKLLMSCLKKLC